MKTLILGKGYIGNYIAKNNFFKDTSFHVSKSELDYTDPNILTKHLEENQYDWIINSTGYTGKPNVDACEDNKESCYYYNVTAPLYITKVANKMNVPIIHIGSGCVYTGYDKEFSETDPTNFGADCFTSSFYSKTKDAFEKLSSHMDRYVFRIRIPFNGVVEPKNYFYKLLKYNNLISFKNSITNVDDLIDFISKFVSLKERPSFGLYNVVNDRPIEGREVTSLMKEFGLNNADWQFVTTEEANFRVARSNCVLSTEKIKSLGLSLPDVYESVAKAL